MSYTPLPQETEGNRPQSITSDQNTQQTLESILKELKKMNLHLSLITDNIITNQEVG
jgi:hypothetical protein